MIHKGEIYITDRYRGGKKDYGRPVLILSSAENNRETGCVVAAPLVSRERYAAGVPYRPWRVSKAKPMWRSWSTSNRCRSAACSAERTTSHGHAMARVEGTLCRLLEL